MRTSGLILILILLGVGLFVVMDHITFHTRELCVWDTEPTRQDYATGWEVPDSLVTIAARVKVSMVENCYGLDLDIEIFNENFLKDWRIKQQEHCENYSDIRIEFDGREFLFSFDEFKAVIEN